MLFVKVKVTKFKFNNYYMVLIIVFYYFQEKALTVY